MFIPHRASSRSETTREKGCREKTGTGREHELAENTRKFSPCNVSDVQRENESLMPEAEASRAIWTSSGSSSSNQLWREPSGCHNANGTHSRRSNEHERTLVRFIGAAFPGQVRRDAATATTATTDCCSRLCRMPLSGVGVNRRFME